MVMRRSGEARGERRKKFRLFVCLLSGCLLGREKAVERLAKGCRHRFYLESMIAFETAIRK
jgi:hypothetical protein